MFPENHWRFSNSYPHEFLKAGILIWKKPSIEGRHTFLSFIKSIFQTLFKSRKLALTEDSSSKVLDGFLDRMHLMTQDGLRIKNSFITLSELLCIGVEINEEGMKKHAQPGIPFFE